MSTINLYNMDCIEFLKNRETNSINLCITSPPYNMNLRIRNDSYCSRQITKEFSTKYKNYDDNLSMEDYFDFNKKIIEELLRTCSIIFYNIQFLTGNKVSLFKLIGYFAENIKEIIIWDKVNSQPAMKEGVLNSRFEVIIVLSHKKEDAMKRQFKNYYFNRGTLDNLWDIKRNNRNIKNHGAVFPLELAEKIIKNFSKEKDIIIDPFMGTGTVGIICKLYKRNFIGIEIDEDYFKLSKNQIESYEYESKEEELKIKFGG